MKHEYSCGAVIFTKADGLVKYVIIESRKGLHGFPKGHMEGRETEEETALREIREEVGLTVTLIPGFRIEANHLLPMKQDVMKHVTYFLASYSGQPLIPQEKEVASARLYTYEEAMPLFEFENTRRVLREANAFLLSMNEEAPAT